MPFQLVGNDNGSRVLNVLSPPFSLQSLSLALTGDTVPLSSNCLTSLCLRRYGKQLFI